MTKAGAAHSAAQYSIDESPGVGHRVEIRAHQALARLGSRENNAVFQWARDKGLLLHWRLRFDDPGSFVGRTGVVIQQFSYADIIDAVFPL